MRAELAPFAADLLLALAGLGVLLAIRLLPLRGLDMLAAFGLAYLVGTAVVPLALVALLVVGVPFTFETFAVVALACIGVGVLRSRGRVSEPAGSKSPEWRRRWGSRPEDVWVGGLFIAIFSAFALVGFLSALDMPLTGWDAWTIWARKAEILTAHDSLVGGFFQAPSYGFAHLDYPLQYPVWEAIHFRAAGSFETNALLRHVWLLLVAFVWAVAYLLRDRVRPIVWAPLLLLAAAAPGIWQQLLTGYADVPMALFACLGAISLALWLGSSNGQPLALAAIMLAAAANTKNEGLMAAVALLLVAGVVGLAQNLRLRQFILASGVFVGAVLPWRLWIAANHIEGDLPISKGLNPGYLLDRTDRVWPSVQAIGRQLADQGRWLYLLPLAAVAIAASLASGVGRRIASFYAISFAVVWGGLVWSYWISPHPLGWHLSTSVGRVISVLMFICLAAVVHLSGLLLNALAGPPHRAAPDAAAEPAPSLAAASK